MSDALTRLSAAFRMLPSVGLKSATRYAYKIIEMPQESVDEFVSAIIEAKQTIHFCSECGDYTDLDVCLRCQTADKSTICVVRDPRDISAIEKTGSYHGLYHALHGTLDFQKGITAERLRIKELISRLTDVQEVIIATNPDISGELTAAYVAQIVKSLGIKVTRLAHGIPMGGEVEYADEVTLTRALNDRKEI
ncbi:MAG: recombination mediator RecR [Christensenellaceae bacterium]|jgi:recombination protein RecR|nr:recombination mediator RecR [Christensenellaceae bacterium]